MKKVIAFGLALFIALVGFQMGAVKVQAAEKASSISKLSNDPAPAPAPAPEKKDDKKKKGDKKDEKK
jgi:hypothetical protein